MKQLLRGIVWLALCLFMAEGRAQETNGTLVFDIKPFRSEVKLKPKIENQLKSGGIEWGIKDRQLVISLVNKRFVAFDINHLTRYGQSERLELPPGKYQLTCIGLEMKTAFSPEKVLAKGGFFNENILTFDIEAGKTTTLSLDPVIAKDMTFLIEWYMPALLTSVTTDSNTTEPKAINLREDGSVAWPDYSGPLKFVAP